MRRGSRKSIEGGPTGIGLGLRWAMLDDVLDGETPPSVGFFEVSPENYMRRGGYFPEVFQEIARERSVITHGLMMNVGNICGFDRDYLRELRTFLERLGATHHSDHLCWSAHAGRNTHDLMPLTIGAETVSRVVDNIRRAQDELGVPLAMENISYYASVGADWAGLRERDFLCTVLERADCGLLLDVNNVYVNAQNHGFDALEYLRGLDLDRVVELHVAGGERIPELGNVVIDTHGRPVPGPVEALMGWVVERIGAVPVLYERDHDIPPLRVLGEEVEKLAEVYAAALVRHQSRGDIEAGGTSATKRETIEVPSVEVDDEAVLDAWTQVVFAPGSDDAVANSPAVFLRESGADEAAIEVLAVAGGGRLGIYRQLVRRAMKRVVRRFLTQTAAHFGAHFDQEIEAWLAEIGPASPYLRDVPEEFVAWASKRWARDRGVAGYLVEIAKHELVDYTLGAARIDDAPAGASEGPAQAFGLDAVLEFRSGATMLRYEHAVHRIGGASQSVVEPERRPTRLLAYRDAQHDVRYLELSELGDALLAQLLDGRVVEEAIRGACSAVGVAVDDETIQRCGSLIVDLGERGVLGLAGR